MSTYRPDRWVILEFNSKKYGRIIKILASWCGGYTQGDAWKLSSGCLSFGDGGEYWEVPQESGSVYYLHKRSEGMSGYTAGIYSAWQQELKTHDATLDIITVEQAYTALCKEED